MTLDCNFGYLHSIVLYSTHFFDTNFYNESWLTYNYNQWLEQGNGSTVKLGDKERFDKEKIGVKEPFPVTNCQFTT